MATTGAILAGKYELLDEIGAGGMGTVFRAKQHPLGLIVAVKLLRARDTDEHCLAQRFTREAQHVARLAHDNIVRILDFGQSEGGELYLVLEYLEGPTLKDVLADPTHDLAVRLRLIDQLMAALERAHSAKIVHRDIKPSNCVILTMPEGNLRLKLLDFGIAKEIGHESTGKVNLTRTGMIVGSAPYMAPEQFRLQAIDFRTDVYSLGALAYEVITGQRLFDGETAAELASQHLRDAPKRPAGIDPKLWAWLERTLQKLPEDRFQTMAEARACLSAAYPPLTTPDRFASHSGSLPLSTEPLATVSATLLAPTEQLSESSLSSEHSAPVVTHASDQPGSMGRRARLIWASVFSLAAVGFAALAITTIFGTEPEAAVVANSDEAAAEPTEASLKTSKPPLARTEPEAAQSTTELEQEGQPKQDVNDAVRGPERVPSPGPTRKAGRKSKGSGASIQPKPAVEHGSAQKNTPQDSISDELDALEAACEGGNAKSCYSLGIKFKATGKANTARILELYELACNANIIAACADIGNTYKKQGSIERALEYFDRACARGNRHSCRQSCTLTDGDRPDCE